MKKKLISMLLAVAMVFSIMAQPIIASADSSEVQKANVGKIKFSNSFIEVGKESADQFKDKFDSNSSIYAVAYLEKNIQSYTKIGDMYDDTYIPYETVQATVDFEVDGNMYTEPVVVPVNVQEYEGNKNYVTFEVLSNLEKTIGYNQIGWAEGFFILLSSGSHEVKFTMSFGLQKVAEGTFTLDWDSSSYSKIRENAGECSKKAAEYRANLRKMPEFFKKKSVAYKDKILSDKNIKAMIQSKYEDCDSVVKLVNVGKQKNAWYIKKDEFNFPVARYSTNDTWAIYKSNDGWCYIILVKVKQDYAGGGTYGEAYIDPVIYPAKIAPANVK